MVPSISPAATNGASSSTLSTQRTLRVLLVRHGETDHNVQGIIQGQLDTPLNARGRAQAALLGEALKGEEIDVVYSSPLQRAADTAIAITHARRETHHLPVHPDDRLKERAFGSLEGRSYKGGKRDSIPGIEQSSTLAERLADFWRDLVTKHAREETTKEITTACIVAHGASLSSLLGCLTEYSALEEGVKPSRLWNCSVTELLVPLSAQSSSSSSSAAEVQASHLLDDVKALEDAKVQGDEATIAKAQLARDEAYRTRAKSAGIVIVRWADVTHLEDEPIGAPRAKGAPEASATKTGVSKVANADEVNA